MAWLLTLIGLGLIGLGMWDEPRRPVKRADTKRGEQKDQNPWDVIGEPIRRKDELIKIPSETAWFLPGRGHRFQQGLLVGLGMGLLIAALVTIWMPRPEEPAEQQPPTGEVQPADPVPPAASDPVPPPNPMPVEPMPSAFVMIVVEPGEMPPAIAAKLKEAGLIADEAAFLRRVEELGLDTQLQAGTFEIPTGAALHQVIDALRS